MEIASRRLKYRDSLITLVICVITRACQSQRQRRSSLANVALSTSGQRWEADETYE